MLIRQGGDMLERLKDGDCFAKAMIFMGSDRLGQQNAIPLYSDARVPLVAERRLGQQLGRRAEIKVGPLLLLADGDLNAQKDQQKKD